MKLYRFWNTTFTWLTRSGHWYISLLIFSGSGNSHHLSSAFSFSWIFTIHSLFAMRCPVGRVRFQVLDIGFFLNIYIKILQILALYLVKIDRFMYHMMYPNTHLSSYLPDNPSINQSIHSVTYPSTHSFIHSSIY